MTTTRDNKRKQKTNTFSFNDRSFQKNDENMFVLSGEMHYFRIDADVWPKHLRRIKDAGLNTVSSYVPWSLHEQHEGKPDFTGTYAPNLNLIRFIDLCNEIGLNLILKPGPFILAELVMHGIPKWFFQNYPQSMASDADGKPYPAKYISLNHPDYREKVLRWYDAVMPVIADHQITHDGPIVLLQVCNEVGLFQWLIGAGDYNPTSLHAYQQYLKKHYGQIQTLNTHYGSEYAEFEQVIAPSGRVDSREHHLAYQDWHRFHREFYAQYIRWLMQEIRNRHVEIPLFHNVPGWVFGRAKDMSVCLSMYHELSRSYPEILLAVDHIPENPSYRNFHDDRLINGFTKAIHGNRGPLYIAELQAGTREACVRVYPNEMELFYKACLANGATAMNFYMFCQGKNPPGWGVYDSSFYLQTPLDVHGETGDAYPVTQRIGRLITTHGHRLCECDNRASQALAFYPPYYYREFLRPLFTGENLDDRSYVQCRLDPRMVTDELLFDSVGKLLAMDNQEYDAVDLTYADVKQLVRYKQIWVATTEQMDPDSQRVLLEYVQRGGHLICFPTVPKLDLGAQPCTLLADGLDVKTDQVLDCPDGMIRWADSGEEIHAISYIETFTSNNGKPVAYVDENKTCGVNVTCGRGSATILGTGFVFQATAHKHAWQKLGRPEHFKGSITCDNPLVITRTRWHSQKGGYLFMLNYHNQPLETNASMDNKDWLDKGRFFLPPCSGLMLPFNLPLSDHCTLAFTSSEILSVESSDDKITMAVKGHPNTPGRAVLRTSDSVKSVLLDGEPVPFETSSQTVTIGYAHDPKSGKPDDDSLVRRELVIYWNS